MSETLVLIFIALPSIIALRIFLMFKRQRKLDRVYRHVNSILSENLSPIIPIDSDRLRTDP